MLVDKKNKAVYMTGLRNGSTLMDEIKEIVGPNRLFRHEFPEDLIKLISNDRSYKIYMPFRNPMIRFKSGLTVNMYNRCGFDTSIIEALANVEYPEYYILYKGMLRYLDNSYANDHNIFHLNYYRPYHLFDTHIDHLLYKPLIYLAYDFDVHMIPLNKFSDHLYKYFPEAISKIHERERPDSFDKSSPLHEKVWDVYKEIFVDNDPEFYKYKYPEDRTLTFNLWMKPELEIFNLFLENYTNVNLLKTKSRALINHFIKTKQYFKDPYSPKTMEIGKTVPMLEVYNKPNKDLHDYVQSYIGIRDRMTDMHKFTVIKQSVGLGN